MGKGLGFYSEIGKKTRDYLMKDYMYDQKFTITTNTNLGLGFSTTGTKAGERMVGDITTSFTHQNISTNVKIDTKSNVFTNVTIDDFAPGAKSIFSFSIPDHKYGKLEFLYDQEFGSVTCKVGLSQFPIVEASGTIGKDGLALGGEMAFDPELGRFTKYNAAIGIAKKDFNASLILFDKGDVLKASYSHTMNPMTKTTIAAEIGHTFSRNENTMIVGGLYEFDMSTIIKARLNNFGQIGALVQYEWRPKSTITFTGEVDTKALENSAKIGLALAMTS
ncbi:unnamed protein product [Sphagnum troendelagicum]